jgi:hypothetical protein
MMRLNAHELSHAEVVKSTANADTTNAIDSMEDRRLAPETDCISIGSRIDIRSSIKKNLCAPHAIELRTNMKRGHPFAARERAGEAQPSIKVFTRTAQEPPQTRGIVQEQDFEEGIINRRTGLQQDSETCSETRGAKVPFNQTINRSLALDELGWTRTSGECLANALGGVYLESFQIISFYRHAFPLGTVTAIQLAGTTVHSCPDSIFPLMELPRGRN